MAKKYIDEIGLSHFYSKIEEKLGDKSSIGHTHTASEVSGLENYDDTEVWAKMGEMSAIQTELIDKTDFIINETSRLYDETRRIDEAKVDKETGKGLSTNDYTTEEKNKLANLAKVATSGSYSDLSGTPTIDKTLSETSTDETVPSSKCVYDAIQNADNRVIATLYLDSGGNDAIDKTFEELKKAYEANKEIVIQLANLIIPCVGTSLDSNGNITAIYFQKALKWPYPLIMTYKVTASGLTSKEDKLISGSKSSIINNSSTNEEFPTAKAVYTAIKSEKGIANGVATLDENVKIPVAQIPDEIARTEYVNNAIQSAIGTALGGSY